MKIEVFLDGGNMWRWHFKSKGRITADAEAFPSRANATRAAKSVVKAVVKCMPLHMLPEFTTDFNKDGSLTITWR